MHKKYWKKRKISKQTFLIFKKFLFHYLEPWNITRLNYHSNLSFHRCFLYMSPFNSQKASFIFIPVDRYSPSFEGYNSKMEEGLKRNENTEDIILRNGKSVHIDHKKRRGLVDTWILATSNAPFFLLVFIL